VTRLLGVREIDAGERLRQVGEESRRVRRRDEVRDLGKRRSVFERPQQVDNESVGDLLLGWDELDTADRLRRLQVSVARPPLGERVVARRSVAEPFGQLVTARGRLGLSEAADGVRSPEQPVRPGRDKTRPDPDSRPGTMQRRLARRRSSPPTCSDKCRCSQHVAYPVRDRLTAGVERTPDRRFRRTA
jgi:hypothetical protein